jgi:hypothetical protein
VEALSMKKFVLMILTVLFSFSLISCDNNRLSTKTESNNELLNKAVSNFYLARMPYNKGELKIYNKKPFKDKYLVLAEKYCGDGQRDVNLFLIDEKYNIVAWSSGYTPINKCFSVNKIDYDGNTIFFGTFNNVKWELKQHKKIDVQISKIEIKFSNKQTVKEDVLMENGYLVVSSSISQIEQFSLYNEKNELQSSLDELEKIDTEIQFDDFKVK